VPEIVRRLEAIRRSLADHRLIVVSNREPYLHRRENGAVVVERPAGGLVAALDPVMQAVSGTWIAWGAGDADFDVTDREGRIRVPPANGAYILRRVHLPPSLVRAYYYGYANQALWPLCHMAMDKARFRRAHWRAYGEANRLFAEAALAEVEGRPSPERQPIVWLQDYHLATCPRHLREARPELFLMHFWHIPWPAWDIFRICPQRAELLDGLLANDLVGFQRPRHAENFLDCAARELGARVDLDEGTVEYNGRLISTGAFPISVDFAALDAVARSPECEEWMGRLRRRYGLDARKLIVGVDRLDYTKGLIERLRALELFLRTRRASRGRVVFVQKTAPSRTQIRAYRELQDAVEIQIRHINEKFGTPEWQPVIYLPRPMPPAAIAALYRLADVCVVSSLQDGMNLVAKEFIASQIDGRGVLLLSELAGAGRELSWAVAINPFDREGFARAIQRAVAMPAAARRERMQHLRAYVAEHDIYDWMMQLMETATRLLAARVSTRWLADHAEAVRRRITERPPVLLLDFDGTLAPIVSEPALAEMPERVAGELQWMLDAGVPVAIVSGRRLDDLRNRVGLAGVIYVGNQGLEMAGPDFAWVHPEANEARPRIAAFCRRIRRRLRDLPGVLVEDKGLTAAVHYRNLARARVEDVRVAVLEEVEGLPAGALVVHQGKQHLEVRPGVVWDKGRAVLALLRRLADKEWPSRVCPIYIGDDRTDEDAFRVLRDDGVTIKVGHTPYATEAQYLAQDVDEVSRFLQLIPRWLHAPRVHPASGSASDH
jgi:alpha,alpha-trehalose-phosphate synthase [UDP-forming]/trehalose-phosphatase